MPEPNTDLVVNICVILRVPQTVEVTIFPQNLKNNLFLILGYNSLLERRKKNNKRKKNLN